MAVKVGSRLGHYEVSALIGEGGMGQVYQATDTKLNRQVALKILPEAFAADPDRLARFQREAQVLASLNHPGIAAIYGIEEADDTRALVLELVEGPTLADRIKQGPIPVDEALPIAKQIAEALEAAHEQGVIHRDLKPANIKVREDGTVKVLDFGLAKALEGDGSNPSESPTVTAAATAAGVILGTAAYMSPEQARGKPVDKRSDIWAFGAALYEMLAGKRPFEGRDVSEVLGGVLRLDPDWDALPSDTPPHLTAYLKRCLEKEPRQRVHDIADVRLAMEGAFETAVTVSSGPVDAPQLQIWQRPIPLVIAGLLLALVSSLAVWTLTRAEVVPADVVRFSIVLPDSAPVSIGNRGNLVISRDGTQVIYSGRQQLNLRPLGQLVGAPIRGGEGGLGPFVSPDGEWVGFLDTTDFRTIKRVPIIGGQSVTLTESPGGFYGASWGTDDQIVFGTTSGLFRVSGGGGEPEALTTIDTEEGETGHTWPFIIPGREAVLFATRASTFGTERLAVLDLRTGERTPLGLAGTNPHYVPTGHLVYVGADGSVRAVAFDATSLEVSGNAVTLVEGVARSRTGAAFSISDNGRLVYVLGPGPEGARKSLVWVDRGGGEELVAAEPANYQEFNLSPDGTRVAIRIIGDEPAVWIYDLTRDNPTRLTFGSDDVGALYPTWTADSAHVAFGPPLSWKRADGTGEVETLSDAPQQFPQAFSPDGTLVFVEDLGGRRLGILTLEGDRTSTLILSEEFSSTDATLSPDGRWLAYRSNETGQREVYVVPFPDVGTGKWQISTDGGVWPLWSQAANELFYMGPDGVMALEFQADTTFTPGAPTLLFERANPIGGNRDMAVSQDGQRFLLFTDNMVAPGDEDAEPSQIHVALNWFQELTERVPTN